MFDKLYNIPASLVGTGIIVRDPLDCFTSYRMYLHGVYTTRSCVPDGTDNFLSEPVHLIGASAEKQKENAHAVTPSIITRLPEVSPSSQTPTRSCSSALKAQQSTGGQGGVL